VTAIVRIGVYGGTFDPLHLGHLAVAEAVREAAGLARVLFVPNSRQPLKTDGPYASGLQRLRMVEAAVAGNPGFALSTLEIDQAGPSYTIESLDALRAAQPEVEWRFILGTDAANGLGSWRRPDRILAEYRPLVLVRAGWERLDWPALERVRPDARALIEIVDVPHLAIASRDLRERIREGRTVRYLVPEPVMAIIEAEGIYGSGGVPA